MHDFAESPIDLDLSDTHELPPALRDTHETPRLLGVSDTHLTIDITVVGKQQGHLVLPHMTARGPAQLCIPVCCIRGNQPGSTAILLSGIHGDEFEGPLTLQRLAREINTEAISGCLIMVPGVNLSGLMQGQRAMEGESQDLDHCFPGKPRGSLGSRLAFELFERLIRPADLVLDLRSGGRKLIFAPCAAVRFMGVSQSGDPDMGVSRSEEAMIAFGAPNSVRLPASGADSCLQAAVTAAGKSYVQTELGGSASCSAETLEIARVGCLNLLKQMGVLQGELQLRMSRMLEVRDSASYIHASRSGFLEPHATLGAQIWHGDPLASVLDLESTGSRPHDIRVPRNGILLAMHSGGPVRAGELVAMIADEVQR